MRSFFEPDREICNAIAHRIFLEMSGVGKEGRKYERMRRDAERMRESIESRIKMQCVYEYFDNVCIKENEAKVAGKTFTCPAFRQIEPDSVKGMYVYAVSVGDFGYPEEPIMDQLYADMWGSAFTDAVRLMMREQFEKEHRLSDSFGPGFYGMDIREMETIGEVLDFRSIGIELRNSRILVPLKACAGMFFAVDDRYQRLRGECLECKGTHSSCQLCQIYGGR